MKLCYYKEKKATTEGILIGKLVFPGTGSAHSDFPIPFVSCSLLFAIMQSIT